MKKELYAVVFFMRYFLVYYRGTKIYIETDHYALQWLMGFDLTDSMYHRWMTELGQYHPWVIKHRPGADRMWQLMRCLGRTSRRQLRGVLRGHTRIVLYPSAKYAPTNPKESEVP